MGGGRRGLRRVCLVAAAACLLVSLGSPSTGAQEEDTVPRPEVFRSTASSLAASVQVDRDALLPVPELFRFILLDGSGFYETSTWQARASLLFPGNGLILGPNLACSTFGGEFPPEFKPILDACLAYKYPLTVFADDFEPDGATSGSVALGSPGDPVSGNAARAKAHAAEDGATTDAVMQDVRVLGQPDFGALIPPLSEVELDTSVFAVDNATSRTSERIVQGSLVAHAEATLSGVRMIGGLLRVGSVRSESHVTDDAKGKRTAKATLEVSGMTFAGVPAQVTDKGLVLGTPSGGGPLAQQQQSQANELLRAFDVRVTTLASEQDTDKDGAAVASVGGLLVEFSRPLEGAPAIPGADLDPNGVYKGSYLLGATGVLGSAFTFGADAVAPVVPPVVDDGGFVDPGVVDGGGGEEVAVPDATDGTTSPPATDDGAADSPPQELARAVGDLFGGRLGFLYLSMMFAVLGLCIVPRLAVPARLPGPRP